MSSPEIAAADALYTEWFDRFQHLFANCEGDVSKTQLISHIPDDELLASRAALGAIVSAAVLAMLDRKRSSGGNSVAVAEIPTSFALMPPDMLLTLDEIILEQGARTGSKIQASDLVQTRVMHWEIYDYRKYKRWLRALDKAARVQAGLNKPPLDDPFLRAVKKAALEQLSPLVARMKDWHRKRRRVPDADDIIEQFCFEVRAGSFPWLSHPHNHAKWMAFLKKYPDSIVTVSAPELFDLFAAFDSRHKKDYTRQKYSSKSAS
jgi:hypothetical protein